MEAILHDRINIADVVNVDVVTLDEAPAGYKQFDAGVPRKFVIDPHGSIPRPQATHNGVAVQHQEEFAV